MNLIYHMRLTATLFILFLFNNISFSQSVKEDLLYSNETGEDVSPRSIYFDYNTGEFCYLKYYPDVNDLVYNDRSIIYKGKESIRYDYNSEYRVFFDSKGNYYAVVTVRRGEDSVLFESMDADSNSYIEMSTNSDDVVLFNGDSIYGGRIEGGSMHITPSDGFQFIVEKDDDGYVIVTYSPDKGIRESKEYFYIDNIYNGIYNYMRYMDTRPPDSLKWTDIDGNVGYLVSDGENMSLLIGDKEIKTDYYHAYPAGFTLDKNGELSYIATIGSRYFGDSGKAFVVQGDKKYREFDMVYYPVMFNSKNEPVYIAEDTVNGMVESYLMEGDHVKRKESYVPGEKLIGKRIYWSVNHLRYIEKDGIKLYDPAYERILDQIEDIYVKADYILKGFTGALLFALSDMVFNDSGEAITYLRRRDDFTKEELAIWKATGDLEMIMDTSSTYSEYGFTKDGKIYFVGTDRPYGEKKRKSTFYINHKALESFPGIVSSESISGKGEKKVVHFNGKNEYAFIGVTYRNYDNTGNEKEFSNFVVTTKGIQIPEGIENGFDRINNLSYLKNDKLFYIGIIEDYHRGIVDSYVIVDNKVISKYNEINNIKYDENNDLVSFVAFRGNSIYKVTIKL